MAVLLNIWYVLWAILLIATFVYEFYAFKIGVPTVPTFPAARLQIIKILKRDATRHKGKKPYTIIDLGSGSGQMTARIARAIPNAHVIGIELSPIPFWRSVLAQKMFGPKNLTYLRTDFWKYNIAHADAIVFFLWTQVIARLSKKLKRELRKNTLIIANDYPLPKDWKVLETYRPSFIKSWVRVYRR